MHFVVDWTHCHQVAWASTVHMLARPNFMRKPCIRATRKIFSVSNVVRWQLWIVIFVQGKSIQWAMPCHTISKETTSSKPTTKVPSVRTHRRISHRLVLEMKRKKLPPLRYVHPKVIHHRRRTKKQVNHKLSGNFVMRNRNMFIFFVFIE